MTIHVVVVDDHQMFREGLRALVARQADMKVVAEAADGQTAVRVTRKLMPNVVVMDLVMPGLNGIEATRQITATVSGVKVVALSMHADKRFVLEAFRAGAVGYVLKDDAFQELVQAIRIAASGKTFLSPVISGVVVEECVGDLPSTRCDAFSRLTQRERQVLQLIAEGRTTKQIAADLGVSIKTVETHRSHVMQKLGKNSVAELTHYAIREGLTPL